ncbi:MAG: sigma-54 dependent transcriptional regulator [Acidobacteria bacterium]|jgi:two-component system nitrogen regulation response regulator NtrX|nr:sigma-54 dependent transcriptional regulator [Acidobacteriota bacterium]
MTPPNARRGLVLVVDDEDAVRRSMTEILEDEGYDVIPAASGEEGIEQSLTRAPDAIFLDVWLPGVDGIEALRLMRERGVRVPVIMISGHGTIETAVKATKRGAFDFVEKPLSLERVLLALRNALRHARLEKQHRALQVELRREAEFIGRGEAVETLRAQLTGAADGRPVLLWGERGTGRSLAARWLSLHGPRPDGPFLDLRAGTIPPERLQRALYGGDGGGPDEAGRIALADEGTLYIEGGEALSPAIQRSLVEGLRTGTFPVPDAERAVRSEPGLIVSLQQAPEGSMAARLDPAFVESFPHRIGLPPLRARVDDLPELVEVFLQEVAREYGQPAPTLALDALHALARHAWPGNVRELRRVAERVVLAAPNAVVHAEDLPPGFLDGRETAPPAPPPARELEARWLRRLLDEVNGDVARAAPRLGLSEPDLRAHLAALGLSA